MLAFKIVERLYCILKGVLSKQAKYAISPIDNSNQQCCFHFSEILCSSFG